MTRTVSTAMAAHLSGGAQTLVTCWYVRLVSGTVLGFTAHDEDLTISGWASVDAVLNGTYLSVSGYQATDTETSAALNVDNMDVQGPQTSPNITEDDLNSGRWDRAKVIVFLVNWADLTMGPIWQRVGHLGEVSLDRDWFKSELRGLTQAYTKRLGELTTPGCRNVFGDSNCQISLTGGSPVLTVTGIIDSVNADGLTIYDSARTEPGPTGSVAIINVTNANPGVVTLASSALNLVNRELVTISGVVGPALINTVTLALNPGATTFQLSIDTSDTAVYPAYVSGGQVDVFSGDTGQYDYGIMTITSSGPNQGIAREVKSYVPGQITLQEPFPFDVQAGDSYTLSPGCDKTESTCHDRYNNVVNFRGEPWLAGIDKLVQVARHS